MRYTPYKQAASKLIAFYIVMCMFAVTVQAAGIMQLLAEANSGDPAAQFELGQLYENGYYGTQKQLTAAMKWYLSLPSSRALTTSHEATLYSLDPNGPVVGDAVGDSRVFHHFRILGTLTLNGDGALGAQRAFKEEANSEGIQLLRLGLESTCLLHPRHGLSLRFEGHVYDYLLCYECGEMFIYQDGKKILDVSGGGKSPENLNKILSGAHVQLPPPSTTPVASQSLDWLFKEKDREEAFYWYSLAARREPKAAALRDSLASQFDPLIKMNISKRITKWETDHGVVESNK